MAPTTSKEITTGLWHWNGPHPDWTPDEPWDQAVSSYAIDDGEQVLLFDPIDPPSEILDLTTDRDAAIVLTAPWHERDTQRLVEQLSVAVYSPPPETAEDLMEKYGLTAEQAGDGSPDLAWLKGEDGPEWHPYEAGDRLPFEIEVFPGREPNDVVLWVEQKASVISGDTLVDFGNGLEISQEWLRDEVSLDSIVDGLRPLLDYTIKHVLPTHGQPTGRSSLERVLS